MSAPAIVHSRQKELHAKFSRTKKRRVHDDAGFNTLKRRPGGAVDLGMRQWIILAIYGGPLQISVANLLTAVSKCGGLTRANVGLAR